MSSLLIDPPSSVDAPLCTPSAVDDSVVSAPSTTMPLPTKQSSSSLAAPNKLTASRNCNARNFKSTWLQTYPFVHMRKSRSGECMTTGCDKMKADAIHHKFALAAQETSGSMDVAAVRAAETEHDLVEGIMQNLYDLAKWNDASSAISDLNKLIIHHNVSKFQPAVKSDNTLPYEHHESVKEMQEAMRDVVRQQLIDDIRDSGMYAMMCDEFTDVSNEKTLVVYVRYAKRGRAETKFFEVSEINGDECNAAGLCETLVLESRGVNLENMCCITTDSASVLTGAVDAVIINYDALLMCLEMEVAEDSDPVAVGLLNFISNYKFLAMLYMLRDVLSKLCTLSLVFQMTCVNLTQQTFTLEATLRSLQEMTTTPGPYLTGTRMVLNPDNLPQNSTDLATYGDQQIHQLGKHYGPSNTNQQSPMTVSEKHLKCEWSLFKHHMDKNHRTMTFSNMAETAHKQNTGGILP
ncbi:hypothetical protein MAR_002473 [Mya arenaria]|uniref:DUF4371 domain-containing protein n=1 Tax=Mya arenaria TaxID=6604 RepID=A0ABY7FER3_MYAAR|nr:hypothetical protein MAR_002473 [Mya arenaria]